NLYVYVGSDPINSTDPTGLTKLAFDVEGGWLYVDPEQAGRAPYKMFGSSGNFGECMNNVACEGQQDTGPTPRGKWEIHPHSPGEMKVRKPGRPFPEGDWGSFRVQLHPSPDVLRFIHEHDRDPNSFFLHGGEHSGTAGCIDVGGGEWGDPMTKR